MKLSALLLTLVIALGITSPLEAKKYKPPKPAKVHHGTYKAPKVRRKPAKMKPMKFKKAKGSAKAPKVSKRKTPKSV
jgi:hypothetical protein